jgi:GR25 family glycosyltransferase involved in LPS biosynthesis
MQHHFTTYEKLHLIAQVFYKIAQNFYLFYYAAGFLIYNGIAHLIKNKTLQSLSIKTILNHALNRLNRKKHKPKLSQSTHLRDRAYNQTVTIHLRNQDPSNYPVKPTSTPTKPTPQKEHAE